MIGRCLQLGVVAGRLHVLSLNGHRREMPFPGHRFVLGRWAGIDPAVAAVVADSIDGGGVVDDGCVVNVVNVGDVDIGHRAIVEIAPVIPTSAFETFSEVAEAINDPAVESDMRAPIATIKNKPTIGPSPIRRGPEQPHFRS